MQKTRIRPAGFEPATCGLEVRCSIQLSYGRMGAASQRIVRADRIVRFYAAGDTGETVGSPAHIRLAIIRRVAAPAGNLGFGMHRSEP